MTRTYVTVHTHTRTHAHATTTILTSISTNARMLTHYITVLLLRTQKKESYCFWKLVAKIFHYTHGTLSLFFIFQHMPTASSACEKCESKKPLFRILIKRGFFFFLIP